MKPLYFLMMILCSVAVVGCGQRREVRPRMPEEVRPYASFFMIMAASHGTVDMPGGVATDVDFSFNRLVLPGTKNPIIAFCMATPPGVGMQRIVIDRATWEGSSDAGRRLLVAHELGHCLLHRAHVGDPPAIMTPFLMPDSYFLDMEGEMWKDLFNKETYGSIWRKE